MQRKAGAFDHTVVISYNVKPSQLFYLNTSIISTPSNIMHYQKATYYWSS